MQGMGKFSGEGGEVGYAIFFYVFFAKEHFQYSRPLKQKKRKTRGKDEVITCSNVFVHFDCAFK